MTSDPIVEPCRMDHGAREDGKRWCERMGIGCSVKHNDYAKAMYWQAEALRLREQWDEHNQAAMENDR